MRVPILPSILIVVVVCVLLSVFLPKLIPAPSTTPAAPSPQPPRTISGEIFIITKGRQTVKLSGARISVQRLQETLDAIHRAEESDIGHTFRIYDYQRAFPGTEAATTADADGKFSITVPAGQYALVADEERAVFDKSEYYHWVVEAADHTTLSNSNLAGGPGSLLPARFAAEPD